MTLNNALMKAAVLAGKKNQLFTVLKKRIKKYKQKKKLDLCQRCSCLPTDINTATVNVTYQSAHITFFIYNISNPATMFHQYSLISKMSDGLKGQQLNKLKKKIIQQCIF